MSKRIYARIALLGLTIGVGLAVAVHVEAASPKVTPPDTVRLQPGTFDYRLAGDFTRNGRTVDAPVANIRIDRPLTIMRTQVSAADYDLCVSDGACRSRQDGPGRADFPVVGVSWFDATAYAGWLSKKTGQVWRLPSDEEWTFAAGSRATDEALELGEDAGFVARWMAKYEQEARRTGSAEKGAQAFGSFGANENGLVDVAGNVWEWTNTCFTRYSLDETGARKSQPTVNCGVRVVAGEHRSYITDFIRDPKSGGCSVGTPPANLGFRLMRDEAAETKPLLARLFVKIQGTMDRFGAGAWGDRLGLH